MSVVSAINLEPAVLGGGGTTLPLITFNNPLPITYTTTQQVIYTSSTLSAGSYIVMASAQCNYPTGYNPPAPTTYPLNFIGLEDALGVAYYQSNGLSVDWSNAISTGSNLQISTVITIPANDTISVVIFANGFDTNWVLQSFFIDIVKIA
jgi:hypothetical protein